MRKGRNVSFLPFLALLPFLPSFRTELPPKPQICYNNLMSRLPRLLSIGLLAFAPFTAHAFSMSVNTGINTSFANILSGVTAILLAGAAPVMLAVFMIGALFMTAAAGDEGRIKKGKDIMIGSLIGLFVILGSYGILRTVLFFIS